MAWKRNPHRRLLRWVCRFSKEPQLFCLVWRENPKPWRFQLLRSCVHVRGGSLQFLGSLRRSPTQAGCYSSNSKPWDLHKNRSLCKEKVFQEPVPWFLEVSWEGSSVLVFEDLNLKGFPPRPNRCREMAFNPGKVYVCDPCPRAFARRTCHVDITTIFPVVGAASKSICPVLHVQPFG